MRSGIQALTISLLNSYANSEHERKVKQIARKLPGIWQSPPLTKFCPSSASMKEP